MIKITLNSFQQNHFDIKQFNRFGNGNRRKTRLVETLFEINYPFICLKVKALA